MPSSFAFSVDLCCTQISERITLFPEISRPLSGIVAQRHPTQPTMADHTSNTNSPLSSQQASHRENQMLSMLREITTGQTELLHRMYFETLGRSRAPDISFTPETIENTYHMEKTLNWDQEEIVTLLRCLLDVEIAPVMAQ